MNCVVVFNFQTRNIKTFTKFIPEAIDIIWCCKLTSNRSDTLECTANYSENNSNVSKHEKKIINSEYARNILIFYMDYGAQNFTAAYLNDIISTVIFLELS